MPMITRCDETRRSRRIRDLMALGEDKRNTVAWRDAVSERLMLDFFRGMGK